MLVLTEDSSSRRSISAVRTLPFQQRFAFCVLSMFAVAFVMFGVLFARSGERGTSPTADLPGLAAVDSASAAVDRAAAAASATP